MSLINVVIFCASGSNELVLRANWKEGTRPIILPIDGVVDNVTGPDEDSATNAAIIRGADLIVLETDSIVDWIGLLSDIRKETLETPVFLFGAVYTELVIDAINMGIEGYARDLDALEFLLMEWFGD